jgi:hypothetical protein
VSTAAEALDAGSVDFLPPEVARLLGALDGVAERPADICERLGAGVDPQGGPAGVTGGLTPEEPGNCAGGHGGGRTAPVA